MVTITIPDSELVEVPMMPEIVLGGPPTSSDESTDQRATVGVPAIRTLSETDLAEDPQLAAFVRHSGFDFHLVRLTCSLDAGPDELVASAVIAVELEAEPESSDGDLIAWSLAPLRLTEKVPRPHLAAGLEVSLGPFLKIKGDWAPPEQASACYVHALGEGEPDPEWRYRATSPESLHGTHNMTMIVRARPGRLGKGSVRINARIGRPGLFRRRIVEMPERFRTFSFPCRSD